MNRFTIEYYDELSSTNEYAKKCTKDRTVIVARSQTNGKGRLGRTWSNNPGEAIMMSAYLTLDIQPSKASMLTLVMALAVSEVLGEQVMIKWPNDLVIGSRKVAGILTEMCMIEDNIKYVILGVGINVNVKEFPVELSDKATSLYLENGLEYDMESMIEKVWESFDKYYRSFLETQDMSELMYKYNEKLVNVNRQVSILESDKTIQGEALGINCYGELMVKLQDGSIINVFSGEVSVRGIYGYV